MKPMLCLTSLLAIPVLVSAQESPVVPVWPHEASDLKPDPKVVFGRLPNGLRYQILPHAEPPKRVSLRLHLEAGSLMEEDDQQGLAHFLEHMAFNGTKNYPAGEMVEFFQRLGMAFGADTNAHTSFDETVYKLELPDGNVDLMKRGMLFLRDVADGMIIGPQELEKERGVIISEKKARDSVEFRSMIEGFKFSLPDSLVPRRLPIGTEDVILKAPRQRFVDFYRRWYRPELMTVIVAGDVQPDAWKAAIVSQFSDLKAPALPVKKPDTGPVRTGHGLQVKLHTEKEAGQVTIGIDTNRPSRKRSDSKATRRERMIRRGMRIGCGMWRVPVCRRWRSLRTGTVPSWQPSRNCGGPCSMDSRRPSWRKPPPTLPRLRRMPRVRLPRGSRGNWPMSCRVPFPNRKSFCIPTMRPHGCGLNWPR